MELHCWQTGSSCPHCHPLPCASCDKLLPLQRSGPWRTAAETSNSIQGSCKVVASQTSQLFEILNTALEGMSLLQHSSHCTHVHRLGFPNNSSTEELALLLIRWLCLCSLSDVKIKVKLWFSWLQVFSAPFLCTHSLPCTCLPWQGPGLIVTISSSIYRHLHAMLFL